MGQLHEYDYMYDELLNNGMDNLPKNFSGTQTINMHSDEPIRGVPFIVSLELSDYELLDKTIDKQWIKNRLLELLVYEMQIKNCIEFTKTEDPINNTTKFRARIFAVPDDKVRLLRLKGGLE